MDIKGKADAELWNTVFHKNKDIVSRRVAGEMLIVPVRGRLADMQRIFALNPVAEYIWQALDEEKSLREIRSALLSRYTIEEEQADTDIRDFIQELKEAELISE